MKISIWQQWASNHSDSFEVVGIFESVDEANAAAEKLREIFTRIAQSRGGYYGEIPTAIEDEYAKLYDIYWEASLDWLGLDTDPAEHVVNYDNYVIATSLGQAYAGVRMIGPLMGHFTNQVLTDNEMSEWVIAVDVVCTMPDKELAQRLFSILDEYLAECRAEHEHEVTPPWRGFAKPTLLGTSRDWYDDQAWTGYVELSEQDSGSKLIFTNLKFGELGYGLPPFIAYLKANGGTNIQYSLYRRPEKEVFGED